YGLTNYRVTAYDKKTGRRAWEVKDAPVYPVTSQRGTRTNPSKGFASFGDFSVGMVFNDSPDTNFAVSPTHIFVPARVRPSNDKKAAGQEMVTVLDATTGAYISTLDVGPVQIVDLTVTPDGALLVSTTDGLRTARTDSFVAPIARK